MSVMEPERGEDDEPDDATIDALIEGAMEAQRERKFNADFAAMAAAVDVSDLAYDPCDRCGARATIRVFMPGTDFELRFCGHHAAACAPQLEQRGWDGEYLAALPS